MNYIYKGDNRDLRRKGIYKITIGEHYYIGKTERSFAQRWREHVISFQTKRRCNKKIVAVLEEAVIEFEIVAIVDDNIPMLESCYINYILHPDLNIQKPKFI